MAQLGGYLLLLYEKLPRRKIGTLSSIYIRVGSSVRIEAQVGWTANGLYCELVSNHDDHLNSTAVCRYIMSLK